MELDIKNKMDKRREECRKFSRKIRKVRATPELSHHIIDITSTTSGVVMEARFPTGAIKNSGRRISAKRRTMAIRISRLNCRMLRAVVRTMVLI